MVKTTTEIELPLGLKFFTYNELKCKLTGRVVLAKDFANRIDRLRLLYGAPLRVNSCCRSKNYNDLIGGHEHSLHVFDSPYYPTKGTCAIDFHMTDSIKRCKLIKVALDEGFSVGVAKTFIHVDDRTNVLGMPQKVFTY